MLTRRGRLFFTQCGVVCALLMVSVRCAIAEDYAHDPFEVNHDVGVVQQHLFDPAGRFHIHLYGGLNPFHALINDFLVGVGVQYNIWSKFGLDARIYQHFAASKQLAKDAELKANPATKGDFFIDFITSEISGHVVWMPVYGKQHIWGTSDVHFILYLFGGVSLLGLDQEVKISNPNTSSFGVSFGGGIRLHLSNLMNISAELRDILYTDKSFKDNDLLHYFVIQVALGITLPTYVEPQRKI